MFFFINQMTAYEMRISDWSSDVCSSDLPSIQRLRRHSGRTDGCKDFPMSSAESAMYRIESKTPQLVHAECRIERKPPQPVHTERRIERKASQTVHAECRIKRSEEHTSELQSLMRISYAVFCLKKK